MLKKILQWLGEIKTDKLLHLIAGILVSQIIYASLSFTTLHTGWILLLSLSVTAIAGGAKEAIDKKIGVPSIMDFLYTVIGGLIGVLLALFISL
jgi:hypothetical protein